MAVKTVPTNEAQAAASTPGGIAAVERALRVLTAFHETDRGVTLGELSRRTGLYKSALSRIMATLLQHRFAMRYPDGRYGLGPALGYLGGLFERSTDMAAVVMPALHALAQETGESTSFYVREGDQRLCLLRVDSNQNVRDHVRVGMLLPLDRGAAGRILRHFADANARMQARDLVAVTIGERDRELAAAAAPVFGVGQRLIGAMCVSGTATRFSVPSKVADASACLLRMAAQVTRSLGGDGGVFDAPGGGKCEGQ